MRYYYQKAKTTDKFLPNMWVCCGGVNEETKDFYLDYFSKTDTRTSDKNDECHCENGYQVIIVEEFHGNVAGRDGRKIEETDILEKHNF